MPPYERPRVHLSSSSRPSVVTAIIYRLLLTLILSLNLGCTLLDYVPNASVIDDVRCAMYLSGFNFLWFLVLGMYLNGSTPFPVPYANQGGKSLQRLEYSIQAISCVTYACGSHAPPPELLGFKAKPPSFFISPAPTLKLVSANTFFSWFFFSLPDVRVSAGAFLGRSSSYDASSSDVDSEYDYGEVHDADSLRNILLCHGPAMRLRGGQGSDSEDFDDSDSPGPFKKRKVESGSKTRKTKAKGKGKAKAVAEPVDQGLRITLSGKNGAPGMFVDEVIDITEASECWEIPQHHRVAYILDVSGTPECLRLGPQKVGTVDRYVKKQCQDTWDGGTGSKKSGLAKVTILNEGAVISYRRSNLTCNGFYTCSLAAPDQLADFERWDNLGSAAQDLISDPNRAAKIAEASDVVATAIAFYRSAMNRHCKAVDGDQVACGGHAVLRKFRGGPANGKAHFVGCSNWSSGDDLEHRFTSVPRELFRGEEIDVEDTEIVEGHCSQIVHPSHLTKNKQCPRIHFRNNKHVPGELTSQQCPAELLILIPVDAADLRAAIIPKSGIPHNHPTFLRSKVPFAAAKKYRSAIDAVGIIGTNTLHVEKAASTKATLGGLLPEELHPSLINKRKRRGMVKDARLEHFPEGMGLKASFLICLNRRVSLKIFDGTLGLFSGALKHLQVFQRSILHDALEACAACTHPWIDHLAILATSLSDPYRKGICIPTACGDFCVMSANTAWSMSAPCLCGQPWLNHEMLEDSAPVQPPCSATATANDNRNAAIARHFPKPKYCPPHAYPANTAKEETFQAQVLLWPNVGLYEPLGSAVPDFVYTIDEFTEMLVALKAHGLSFIAVLPSGESSNLVDKLSSQLTAHVASHNLVLPRMPESLGPVTDPVPWFRRPFMVLQASRRKAIYTFAQHVSANGNNFNRKFILDTNSKFTNPDVEHSGLPLIVLAPRFGHVQGPLPPMLSPDALYASSHPEALHSCFGYSAASSGTQS
ncbi:hypothetical protein B0H17DRAFT_1135795 [Mycena rosella]|uniref:Uncharacterized protein n=1 Tax=Mycena rosella TaxID=1033263 RepID=A0AAD7GF54_MYCRO|nr:hypothetical protein B0H17DRAFT_1135795 [Mycena rosella]